MKVTTVYLHDNQLQRLKILSDRTGVPMAEFIRRAIDSLLHDSRDLYLPPVELPQEVHPHACLPSAQAERQKNIDKKKEMEDAN